MPHSDLALSSPKHTMDVVAQGRPLQRCQDGCKQALLRVPVAVQDDVQLCCSAGVCNLCRTRSATR